MPPSNASGAGMPGTQASSAERNGSTTADLPSSQPIPEPSPDTGSRNTDESMNKDIEPIDYQALEYVDNVDETLICPICKTPFWHPVTANRCGHTFCESCIHLALQIQPVCPLDREPMVFQPDSLHNTRIITHQLDRLRVKCPNRQCSVITSRDAILQHHNFQCLYTMAPCPEPTCSEMVRRLESSPASGCLHYETACARCDKSIQRADMSAHLETECLEHWVHCPHCGTEVVRCKMDAHEAKDCPDLIMQCQWHSFGCRVAGKRGAVAEHHESGCVYEAIGQLTRERSEDRILLDSLRIQVLSLSARLQQLEAGKRGGEASGSNQDGSWRPRPRAGAGSAISSMSTAHASASHGPYRSSTHDPSQSRPAIGRAGSSYDAHDDYMLALQFERMELALEDMRKAHREMDRRHGTMLMNEVMPIKEQVAEMRSNLGVLNMHTTWLMNFQRRSRFNTGGPSSPAAVVAASGVADAATSEGSGPERAEDAALDGMTAGFSQLRRLSDGMRENPPRL